jgi:hypothetical protein
MGRPEMDGPAQCSICWFEDLVLNKVLLTPGDFVLLCSSLKLESYA